MTDFCVYAFLAALIIGRALLVKKMTNFHPPIRISQYKNLIAVDVLFAHVAKGTPVKSKLIKRHPQSPDDAD